MKKYLIGLIIGGIVFGTLAFQTKNKPTDDKKIVHKGTAFLLNGMSSGKISKKVFDSLLDYTLIARDTQNREHPVLTYNFTYAERGIYEDSTGRMLIMADYNSVESDKGKLPDFWIKNLRKRTKEGDTVMFTEIMSTYQDSARTRFYTKPLKFIITE